ASTVTNTQTVRVRHTSSATPGTSVNTTLTIGPKSDTFTSTTVGPDTDPVAFNFVDQTGVALGSTRTSAAITISGINVPATISVSGGSYQINGTGAFISTPSTITDGQTVRVQHTASANTATTVDTTLTVGTVSDIFTSTTATAAAITPDAFTFPSPRNVIVLSGSAVQSNAITISGLSAVAGIIVQDGEYSINGGAFIAQVGTVQNGDVIRVRHVASGAIGGVTTTTLTIGTATTTFSSTTTDQGIIGIEASTDGGGGSIAWLDLLLVLLLMLTLGATRTFHNRGQ
ncbi:MAG: hypothetical protein ACPG47_02010, partial [Leucothrix sp.]